MSLTGETALADTNDPDDFDGPVAPDVAGMAAEAAARRQAVDEVNLFEGVRDIDGGPVLPVRLGPDDMFCFSCHRGISCWNSCCHGADVMLTPYDILRLSHGLDIRPAEFLDRYAYRTEWERAGLPVAKLKMADNGAGPCVFLGGEEGCTVYDDRPVTCRYYPLGLGTIKLKDDDENDKMNFHFLVREPHCKGHEEDKLQSVGAYRAEQGVEPYDAVNRGWMDILMKMTSWRSLGGPQGKEVAAATKQMFYMVSTDIDALRNFVFDTRFLEIYAVEADAVEQLKESDEALLTLGFDWMKNVLFNEPTIGMKEDVLQAAVARTRAEMGGA